jgi:hypothetical protein
MVIQERFETDVGRGLQPRWQAITLTRKLLNLHVPRFPCSLK